MSAQLARRISAISLCFVLPGCSSWLLCADDAPEAGSDARGVNNARNDSDASGDARTTSPVDDIGMCATPTRHCGGDCVPNVIVQPGDIGLVVEQAADVNRAA